MADSIIASLAQENLAEDPLLVALHRDEEGRPLLGGIPLVCRILKGGMEAVYYGVHPQMDAEVAVRVLPLSLAKGDPELGHRLSEQARKAQEIEDPHIVRILDFSKEAGLHFIVMEYVAGDSAGVLLRRLMATGRAVLAEAEAIAYITSATRGLAAAHASGVLHRDIRPDNILVSRSGSPPAVLAGFGLAKPEGLGHAVGRQVHYAMGTPGFMAPEQARDWRAAGPAADVFAMGATLYALLAGYPPFTGTTLQATLKATETKEPDELPESLGQGLKDIIARCLAKQPEARYQDGYALLLALAPIAGEQAGPRPEPHAPAEEEPLNLEGEMAPPSTVGVPAPPSTSIRLGKPEAPRQEEESPRVVARRMERPVDATEELSRILSEEATERRSAPEPEPTPEPEVDLETFFAEPSFAHDGGASEGTPSGALLGGASEGGDSEGGASEGGATEGGVSEEGGSEGGASEPRAVVAPTPPLADAPPPEDMDAFYKNLTAVPVIKPEPVVELPPSNPAPVAPPPAIPFNPAAPPPIQVAWPSTRTRLGYRRRSALRAVWDVAKLLLAIAMLAGASYALIWVLTKYV